MSSMLEQAIIDAAALRETAMKSAEASLIEKYNKEFKQTVEKLLEQEMQPADAAANAANPTGPTVAPTDPMAAAPSVPQTPSPEKKDVFSKVKSAFFDLEGDDDELITINFDGLKAKPVDNTTSTLSTPSLETPAALEESLDLELDEMYDAGHREDQYGGQEENEEELDESDSYEEENEEELELELEEGKESEKVASAVTSLKKKSADGRAQAAKDEAQAQSIKTSAELEDAKEGEKSSEEELEETIELSEDELAELEESLRVDMENKYEGYMGSTERKKREFKAVAYAKARDDKKTEKREKMKKTIGDLQEAIEKIATKFVKEQELNNELLATVSQLKEQVEQTNLSNAKLLYTNKALGNISLNERQKQQIVENISKASSVLEAKTIYETLQSTVASKPEVAPKSLSEALNRGNSPFLARPKQPASINDLMAERMRLLAGIKS
jgi:hypothetical protein